MKLSRESERSSGKARLSIFIDANTIVSGLLFSGNESFLLKLGAVGACELVATKQVMEEVAQALRAEEFKLSENEAAAIVSLAHRAIQVRENVAEIELQKRYNKLNDKKDVQVLAAFETLKCGVLVTGDKELLAKVSTRRPRGRPWT